MTPLQLVTTRTYERAIRKLISEDAREEMEAVIVADPDGAPVVQGTGGIDKLRWAAAGRGKRGGIRTNYFFPAGPEAIYSLTACEKADRDDLTPTDKRCCHGSWPQSRKRGPRDDDGTNRGRVRGRGGPEFSPMCEARSIFHAGSLTTPRPSGFSRFADA